MLGVMCDECSAHASYVNPEAAKHFPYCVRTATVVALPSQKPLTGRTMSPEGERAVALLAFANYSAVATALGVSRTSVARWAKGDQVTPWQLSRLEQTLGFKTEEPRPEWTEALIAAVTQAVRSEIATALEEALVAQLDKRLGPLPPPLSEGAADPPLGRDEPTSTAR
jgi:DNA-binding transcriptional regulator YdaS (Cro superfamily)